MKQNPFFRRGAIAVKAGVLSSVAVGALLFAGCTAVDPDAGALAPPLGFFSSIKTPSGLQAALRLKGKGAQLFRCERLDKGYGWVFRQPEADLLDATGRVVGRHGANFTFEHADGSLLVGTVASYEDAPKETDLRWLLLNTKAHGRGAFAGITHIQRINTQGGMPPPQCRADQQNQVLRVEFSADFVFYKARSS